MDRLEVWEERDQWRWAYRDGNGVDLRSNQVYAVRSEAERAAQLAYPDLPLEVPGQVSGNDDRRILIAIVTLLLLVVGLTILAKRVQRQEEGG